MLEYFSENSISLELTLLNPSSISPPSLQIWKARCKVGCKLVRTVPCAAPCQKSLSTPAEGQPLSLAQLHDSNVRCHNVRYHYFRGAECKLK